MLRRRQKTCIPFLRGFSAHTSVEPTYFPQWAGVERGMGHEVLSRLQGAGGPIFSYTWGWVTPFYYIGRHTLLILTRQLITLVI